MNLKVPGAIGDVANWKRHQRLDEILIVFTRTTSEKTAKLFSKKKKKSSCHTIRPRNLTQSRLRSILLL